MLGVAAIRPVVTRRTDVPMKAVSGARQGRWDRTVMSSVKQCGRAVVPRVYAAQEFADVLRTTQGKARLMFVEPGGGGIVLESAGLERDPPSEAVVFVGPEGGWDPQEISAAAASGVTLLSFGRRVLRADAAGAAVLSVLRYIWRDL
jgi:16S rRNA (uracil1498-N3)-methyltransferase